jgi:hypothetical protein
MNKQLIDDLFYVEEKKYGLWQSHLADGTCIITSLTEEECTRATRWYLKQKQEGFDKVETKVYDGVVGGKL